MTSSKRATDVSNRWRPFMWPFIGAAAIALADQGIKLDVFVESYHWPTFNLADSAVTIGAGILVLASFRRRPAPGRVPSGDASGVRHL